MSVNLQGFQTVRYGKQGGIGYIWLNRPSVLNAYNLAMRDELFQVLSAAKDDDEVGVVVLRGVGRAFCAGADLSEFGTAPSQVIARQVRWERDVWGSFLEMSKPLICAIHGYCMGSGVEMALLCDLRVATEDAIFAMPEATLGLIPAAGGTQTLPRTLGLSAAMDLLLSGKRVGAQEALELGLVGRVVHPDELDREVESMAEGLLALDRSAMRAAKRAVWEGMDLPLASGLALELRLAAQVAGGLG